MTDYYYDIDAAELLDEEEFHTRLLAHRGGCGCNHPPYNPPCSACTNPWTFDELEALGIKYISDGGPEIELPAPAASPPALAIDYSAITKGFCE